MPYKNPDDQKKASKAHYEANKEVYKARAVIWTTNQRKILRDLIDNAKSIPCTDCETQYDPWIMDFDHVEDNKEFTIGNLANSGCGTKRVLDEIAKCEVVCANCHRIRTHNRKQARVV